MRKIDQTLCYTWFQRVWNDGQREAIPELLTPDVIAHGLSPDAPIVGIAAFEEYYDNLRKELKDIHVEVNDVISEDDMESVHCSLTATHIASGKKVQFQGQCMLRKRDGRIAEAWNNFDFFGMQVQLGYKLTLG